jgi:hypothetical protein
MGNRWWVAALVLDKETATFSLSKFQLYLWTAAAIFGYLYLSIARGWVQGVWTFLDIPKNLPGIIFIGGGTTVIAQFITSGKGPKGAGETNPSYADFVSTGGVIVADRFQFFIWTLLGTLYFMWLVIISDPATIQGLPTVPDSFLQLMGISSLGYLGGKLARRPGPIIDDIDAQTTTSRALLIRMRGRVLSPSATFKIDDVLVTSAHAPILPNGKNPAVLEEDDETKPEITGKLIEFTISQPLQAWLKGQHTATISNPDGQAAAWPFYMCPVIGAIAVTAPATGVPPNSPWKLTLTGRHLSPTAIIEIDGTKVLTTSPPQIPVNQIEADPAFGKQLVIEIAAAQSSLTTKEHKLQLTNPDGQTAELPFQ